MRLHSIPPMQGGDPVNPIERRVGRTPTVKLLSRVQAN